MKWVHAIGHLAKLLLVVFGIYVEKDKKKASEKAELAKEMIDAFKQPNKKTAASRLNTIVNKLNRLR